MVQNSAELKHYNDRVQVIYTVNVLIFTPSDQLYLLQQVTYFLPNTYPMT